MVRCMMCLEEIPISAHKSIDIFSAEGMILKACDIISKHFWFRPKKELDPGQQVCQCCWEAISDFNQYYEKVVEAHKNLNSTKTLESEGPDEDPLPDEEPLRDEEPKSEANEVMGVFDENFFNSEVKVEVHDLDLLPKIEIIDSVTSLSNRSTRALRRRQIKDNSSTVTLPSINSIKEENSLAESDMELQLFHPKVNLSIGSFDPDLTCTDDTKPSIAKVISKPQKRCRGRPKKSNEVCLTQTTPTSPVQQTPPNTVEIKAERLKSDNEDNSNDNFMDSAGFDQGTDDSDTSSTTSSDWNASLPDAEPQEKYASIPKRIVLKPKKYRKRPKPLVPPKRMTREEIDRKNAKQIEYDQAILKFFGKFSCPKCNLLVQNFAEMKQHFRASHSDEPGFMTCCGRKFQVRKALAEHVYIHWNPDHFKCTRCDRIFQDSRTLEVHELTHTNPPLPKEKKVFQCDKCPKAFTTKAAFEYHSFSKHVPKSEFQFSCKECNKKLPTQRKLKDHMKYMHDPESAIICDKCGKKVRSQSNLKKHHLIEHSDEPRPIPKPMQCEICGTWLRHISGLKQHMKTIHEDNSGEHRCKICNKTSTNARALKRHIYHNHECERKFKCTLCEKAFKRPQDLREHTSTHTGEVLYTCPNCPMTFFSNANMYKHRQRLHRAEWEADRKKPVPPNIMQQAVGATAAMKLQQSVGASSAFFMYKLQTQNAAPASNNYTTNII